jgi:hypothetical protein
MSNAQDRRPEPEPLDATRTAGLASFTARRQTLFWIDDDFFADEQPPAMPEPPLAADCDVIEGPDTE